MPGSGTIRARHPGAHPEGSPLTRWDSRDGPSCPTMIEDGILRFAQDDMVKVSG